MSTSTSLQASSRRPVRVFTRSEERHLTDEQKDYLGRHPNVVSLQPQMLANEALYNTVRHGAVTVARALELEALYSHLVQRARKTVTPAALTDTYSAAEDAFIDRHGMSSGLY